MPAHLGQSLLCVPVGTGDSSDSCGSLEDGSGIPGALNSPGSSLLGSPSTAAQGTTAGKKEHFCHWTHGSGGGSALIGGGRDRMGCSAHRNEPQAPKGDTKRPRGAPRAFSFPPVHGMFPIKPHFLLKPLWMQQEPRAQGWRVARGGIGVTAPPQPCSEQRQVCLLWQPQDKPPSLPVLSALSFPQALVKSRYYQELDMCISITNPGIPISHPAASTCSQATPKAKSVFCCYREMQILPIRPAEVGFLIPRSPWRSKGRWNCSEIFFFFFVPALRNVKLEKHGLSFCLCC